MVNIPGNKYFSDEDSLKLRTGLVEVWQSVFSDEIPMSAKLPQSVKRKVIAERTFIGSALSIFTCLEKLEKWLFRLV